APAPAPAPAAAPESLPPAEAKAAPSAPTSEVKPAPAPSRPAEGSAAGEAATAPVRVAAPVLEGVPTRAPRGPLATVVAALSGWMLLRALGGLVGRWLLGLKREDRYFLEDKSLRREHRTELLGRTIREGKEYLPYGACLSVARETQFRATVLLVGLGALVAGTMVGVGMIFDGIRGAFLRLVLAGFGVLLAGIVLDLVLFVLADGAAGRVFVTFRLTGRRAYRLRGARRDAADRFIDELARRLPPRLEK
ncbi:MAG TPA: hypothetical protein VG389_20570, partial [Myxococcota bacterium]|nr:hypothetical protein [Myxococcota bacterium]